jgi:hypothetical protein
VSAVSVSAEGRARLVREKRAAALGAAMADMRLSALRSLLG